MYLDWGTVRVKRAANNSPTRGGGVRQSTRADRYRRAAAAELLLLWECTPITHWEWVWALVQVWVWVWVWVWV